VTFPVFDGIERLVNQAAAASCRRLAAKNRQVVLGLQAQPEFCVAPAKPL